MREYLEKFTYNHESIIFGEYVITYQVYKEFYKDNTSDYGIRMTNNLTEVECYFEEYSTYDEAVEDVHRLDKLEATFERQFADEFY